METNFNFKSQICTSIEQSERLLSLGLKKETADCYWWQETDQYGDGNGKWHLEVLDTKEAREHFEYLDKIFDDELFIPAWSLHRLLSLLPECVYHKNKACFLYLHLGVFCEWRSTIWDWEANDKAVEIFDKPDLWENLIDCIEWLIKEGYFNKEYLDGTTEN